MRICLECVPMHPVFDKDIHDICVIAGSMAQPEVRLSTQDLQLFQQSVAKALSENPHFKELMNMRIAEATATKSELDQASKYAKSGTNLALCIPAPALPYLM